MKTFNYTCIKVQQTPDSLPLYVSTAKAEDLLKWCDVPRSKEGFMAGYQRELEGRHEKITEFFQQDPQNNIIPNSVIIAIDESQIEVNQDGKAWNISVKVEEQDFKQLLVDLIAEFESRLTSEEKDSIALEGNGSDVEETEDNDSATPPASYLAELTKQLRVMQEKPEELTDPQKEAIIQYATSVSLPGLIIDGQHRVFGAKEVVEFSVEFPVVFIPGLDFSEQVFHFTC